MYGEGSSFFFISIDNGFSFERTISSLRLVRKVTVFIPSLCSFVIAITKEQSEGMNTVTFRTNLNDEIVLSKENPLSIEIKKNDEPSPYITVRNNLRALISRSVFYELVDLAETIPIDGVPYLAIKSQGEIFKIHKVEDL